MISYIQSVDESVSDADTSNTSRLPSIAIPNLVFRMLYVKLPKSPTRRTAVSDCLRAVITPLYKIQGSDVATYCHRPLWSTKDRYIHLTALNNDSCSYCVLLIFPGGRLGLRSLLSQAILEPIPYSEIAILLSILSF